MKALIARKIGMTSVLTEDGRLQPVTLLSAKGNVVTQLKDVENDGYMAVQLGAETAKKPSKSLKGHFAPTKLTPKIMREFRINEFNEDLKVGATLTTEVFSVGDRVSLVGTSKGKGFAGTIKRHNFHRGPKTHGGRSYRRPGSIGSMYPQKIFKGKKMAGQMGYRRVTTKNLKVAIVDTQSDVIGLIGSVPGPKKSVVLLRGIDQ